MKKFIFTILFASILITTFLIFNSNKNDAFSNETNSVFVPEKRSCGTVEYMESLYKMDPAYRQRMIELEKYAESYAKQYGHQRDASGIITIPVVVHVVWNTAAQNISDDQVLSQIDVLNKDFRRLNSDTTLTPLPFKPLAADCQIQFAMARRDPGNNPTLGITRTQTSIASFGQSSAVKFTSQGGHDAWDRDKYLNFWSCNIGGSILGYATFPGGSASLDGVVIGYNFFGTVGAVSPPFNKGRTATHEVGHWLWLYHIWGDDGGSCGGSDLVGDTPNQALEFYGCPSYPTTDACSPSAPGVMFMNYMDYTDDACMNLFTQGQLTRINAAIEGPRLPIQTSNGHVNVSGTPLCSFKADSLSIEYGNQVHFSDISAGIPTGWQWTFTGGTPANSTVQNPVISYSTPGLYTVKLRISNTFGSDSLTRTSYIRVRGAGMSPFSLISPVTFTRITVSGSDTSKLNFSWTKSSTNPTVNYKIKLRKIGSSTDYFFTSNLGGLDTTAGVRKSTLDSLAGIMGTTGDSVRCTWRAWSYNGIDSLSSSGSNILTLVRSTIGIQIISSEIPASFNLYNNYPNPFNPVTRIKFDIPNIAGNDIVNLAVFDILGKQSAVLVNQYLKAGKYEADWDASNYPSGVYFYRISAGEYTDTRKMILIK
ncbi:MAG: T9SS type A sorting domain-containing protein [Ignavibacteria bacterium]|nr:T9SS type A sorting domain-containing protein [Ignavibacteria bacterium]